MLRDWGYVGLVALRHWNGYSSPPCRNVVLSSLLRRTKVENEYNRDKASTSGRLVLHGTGRLALPGTGRLSLPDTVLLALEHLLQKHDSYNTYVIRHPLPFGEALGSHAIENSRA